MLKFLTKESDSEHQLALAEREQQSDAAESNIFDFTEQREPNKFKKATIQSCIAKGSRRPEPTFCQLTALPKRSGPAPFRKVSRGILKCHNLTRSNRISALSAPFPAPMIYRLIAAQPRKQSLGWLSDIPPNYGIRVRFADIP